MSVEWKFLNALLASSEVDSITRFRVTSKTFTDYDAIVAFNVISSYVRKYRRLPTHDVINSHCEFRRFDTDAPLEELAELLKQNELRRDLSKVLDDVSIVASGDPREALSTMRSSLSKLSVDHTEMTAWSNADVVRSLDRYDYAKEHTGITGMPYPWPYLTEQTGGLHPGDFIVLQGKRKARKTWIWCVIAHHIHQFGSSILVLSEELDLMRLQNRFLALEAKVPWTNFRQGSLNPHEERKMRTAADSWKESAPVYFDQVTSSGDRALSDLAGLIESYRPEAVFWDSVNLLGGRDWLKVGSISTGLKRIAKMFGIPIVVTTQARDDGNSRFHSFEEDCDLLVLLQGNPLSMDELVLEFPASREAYFEHKLLINARVCEDFTQKSVIPISETASSDIKDEPVDPFLNEEKV